MSSSEEKLKAKASDEKLRKESSSSATSSINRSFGDLSPPKFQGKLNEDLINKMKKSKPGEIEEALSHFKWIEAIRTADMNSLAQLVKKYQTAGGSSLSAYGTPLHLACSFAKNTVVDYLLKITPKFPINAQDSSGNTCLHLAARSGRVGIVETLMKNPDIDCTLTNLEGRDPIGLAKSGEVVRAIEASRKQFITTKAKEIHTLSQANDFAALQRLYSGRVARLIDINDPDPMTGDTVLHDAATHGNYDMVVWCLKMKADPLVRDKKGKLAVEKTKSDKIKTFLKGVLSQSTFAVSSPTTNAITMQGMLYKWTNYAGGYKKRWFVLEGGILSYYRSQEDVPVSCRGSISLKVAKLWIDSSDRNRFDIIGRGSIRYHLRAEHPMEAKRWVIALTEAKQWLQDNKEFKEKVEAQKRLRASSSQDQMSHQDSDTDRDAISEKSVDMNVYPLIPSVSALSMNELAEESPKDAVPFDETFHATANSALACVHYQQELIVSIAALSEGKHPQLFDTFNQSLKTLQRTLNELISLSEQRDAQFRRELEREKELNRMWEENLRALATEHDEFQELAAEEVYQLETQARKTAVDVNQYPESEAESDEFFDAESELKRDMKLAVEKNVQVQAYALEGYWKNPPKDIRKHLPMINSEAKFEMSLWSVLKNNIGKDLSKIALPVFFNEPMSMLQRLCEDMEYSTLLDLADARSDALERIQFVAAFAMSNYSSTLNRTSKPFNPLLGETFEYVRKDLGFRYLAEQVSHHPPISACYCESDHYIFWQEASIKSKFWGKSFEIFPLGNCHVILKKSGEHYSWKKVTTCVNNLIIGKLWLDHYGDMVVTNHKTGDTCTLTFKPAGWRGKEQYEIAGKVRSASDGQEHYELWGQWTDKLMSKPLSHVSPTGQRRSIIGSGGAVLWKRNALPADSEKMFHFTEFAVSLNDTPEGISEWMCKTDSRIRPDQRAMENGNYDEADKEKVRLEEKQRVARRARHEEGIEWEPTWFRKDIDKDTGEDHWVYKGGYWEARKEHFVDSKVRDIF